MRDTHLREEKVRLDTKLDDYTTIRWMKLMARSTRIINRSIESNLVSLAKNGILIHRANRSIWQNSAIEETNLESISIREFKKIILSRIHCDFEYRFFFFFFLIQLRFCEQDRWRRKKYLSILYPRNASIGSVLERGVYSIYSHDYSRALYFADRATLSIDFFRYGNWDSGVDLTVLGSPCPFFHDLVVHGRGR